MQTTLRILERAGGYRPTPFLKIDDLNAHGLLEVFTDKPIRG
jgi:hypothetical protein